MQVTAAQPEDCRALAGIHVTSWQAAYASLFPAEYLDSLSVTDREESWTSILKTSVIISKCWRYMNIVHQIKLTFGTI